MPPNADDSRSTTRRWRDRIVGADPGQYALRIALRAAISLGLSTALLLAIAARLGQPSTVALVGAQIAMMVSSGIMDPHTTSQRRTFVFAVLAAAVSVALAALVEPYQWLSGAMLCAVTFAAVRARGMGPRGVAAGLLAFMGYFAALYVGASAAMLPSLMGAVAIGGAIAFVVHFWLVPERVAGVRESVLRAFLARVQLLLDDLVEDAESGRQSEKRATAFRRSTGRIGELALALEEAVGRADDEVPPPDVREWLGALLHAQLAVDMLAESVHTLSADEPTAERRRVLVRLVRALQRWMDDGDAAARDAATRELAAAHAAYADTPRAGDVALWWRLDRAVETLTAARPWAAFPALDPAASRVTIASFRPGGGGEAGVPGMSLDLRLAIQATIAVALSMVVGRAISPTRWYWAVLAAFVVYIRATTLGETLSRAWQRVLGTVLGVAAGLGVAALVGHRTKEALAVGLVAVFFAYYLMRISYTAMIVFFTIALSLLYEMMGRPLPGLLELRIAETLVGAVIGVAVSALVLPAHSDTRVRVLAAGVARAATGAIARATTPGVRACDDALLHDEIRTVDRALAELRNALRPLWGPNVPIERSAVTRQGRVSAALAYAIRRLANTPLAVEGEHAPDVKRIGAALVQNCDAVADALEAHRAPPLVAVEPLVARLASDPESSPGAALLLDIDRIVRELAVDASRLG
ncbi:MAG: putative integral rane protein [Gemmatimonadetes bacterium]|nr:putative integral rane protein [Gemmatimonadota bacterium]